MSGGVLFSGHSVVPVLTFLLTLRIKMKFELLSVSCGGFSVMSLVELIFFISNAE